MHEQEIASGLLYHVFLPFENPKGLVRFHWTYPRVSIPLFLVTLERRMEREVLRQAHDAVVLSDEPRIQPSTQ